MSKSPTKSALSLIALTVLALLHTTPTMAQGFRTFVSNTGSDLNDCGNVDVACVTFQRALSQTFAGGEIIVVGAGTYGTVTITHSVHITNDGAGAAVIEAPFADDGIIIAAGIGDVVSLRGLVIDGGHTGINGIAVESASAVHIQNCVIRNFQGSGAFGI